MKRFLHLGSFAVVIAAILWSCDGLLRRQLFNLPATVIVFWEHIVGLLVLIPFVGASWKQFLKLTKKQWITIGMVSLLSGALGTIMYTAALSKVQFIPFSVVVLLQQLQPVFAIAAAAIVIKEPLSRKFIFLAVLALIAAYGVSFPDLRVNLETGSGTAVAALLAAGAAAAWGVSTALSKYSLKDTSFLHITAARFALAPVFALILMAAFGHTSSIGSITGAQWGYIIAITFSTGMVALALYYFGLKRILASRSTMLELVWPLSSLVIGYALLHDRLTITQGISAALLLVVILTIGEMSADKP